jgi:hypothetical protein
MACGEPTRWAAFEQTHNFGKLIFYPSTFAFFPPENSKCSQFLNLIARLQKLKSQVNQVTSISSYFYQNSKLFELAEMISVIFYF